MVHFFGEKELKNKNLCLQENETQLNSKIPVRYHIPLKQGLRL